MFSKELEEVMDAALADGVITDKERAVLHKRAEVEGIDPDELDVVIDGRLAKTKKEKDWLRPTPPITTSPSSKVGNVMKCPNCGAPYQPGSAKCTECGHVFQNMSANSSSQVMADGIQEIMNKWAPKIEKASKEEKYDSKGKRTTDFVYDIKSKQREEIKSYILNFPIPSTKDDLLEFITVMSARRHSDSSYEDAYRAKLKETINKAKVYFPDDPQFSPLIEKYTKLSWENLSSSTKALIGLVIMMVICFIGLVIIGHIRGY